MYTHIYKSNVSFTVYINSLTFRPGGFTYTQLPVYQVHLAETNTTALLIIPPFRNVLMFGVDSTFGHFERLQFVMPLNCIALSLCF